MISEHAFETLFAFIDEAVRSDWGPARERVELIKVRAELDRAYREHGEHEVATADPDPVQVQHIVDAAAVDHAVRHHTREGLKHVGPATRPGAADLWPTATYALASWHLLRAQLLEVAPVEVAAAMLREEALAALDTNPKDTNV